ncbi:type II/IV secretion system ATPase subunit [Candidatus Woesearchaeota archaeon]|nr:type II/IV secretion system ATPase subunit [Candidatus Woesearchaeota archaeon]
MREEVGRGSRERKKGEEVGRGSRERKKEKRKMAIFQKEAFTYDIIREGQETVLKIDCDQYTRVPSLEDDPYTFQKTCDILNEAGAVTKIVYFQKRNYEYDYDQTLLVKEISELYLRLYKERDTLSYNAFVLEPICARFAPTWYAEVRNIVSNLLRSDPIGAYVSLKRLLRDATINQQKNTDASFKRCSVKYLQVLSSLIAQLEKTRLITLAQQNLAGFEVGKRDVYRIIFHPFIKPDFLHAKLMSKFPDDGEEIDSYEVNRTEVTIFSLPDTVQYLYHIVPPEFKLSEDSYEILDTARKIMTEHKPEKSEFIDPERMRTVFSNIGRDLIEELLEYKKLRLTPREIEELTTILVRYTVGFGLIEVLLQDEKIQDITINSPMGESPIFLVHAEFGDCRTNITPTETDAESWASKMRLISGRPLDEANPILDTELNIPGASARVSVISSPLNPTGLAYAFRRHRDKPWTLPLFIHTKMINPLGAGMLSFIIDGSRTMLVAGTRSAGKTSLLGSILTEIMRKYRIITIEDTLELPVPSLRKMGYNIQQMKVAAALSKGSSEVSAEEGIRTTLRLGDSALIVGEIRSKEARSLYEAMRVGALANVVAGTIHGDSPYGVYDRVVNDLEVPKTSFKATDIIVVANPIRTADGMHKTRKVTQITEVRKHWENDPLVEGGFSDLMKYDSSAGELIPGDDLINGESEILKSIAGSVREWAGNWDAVWDNILLRAKMKETIVDFAVKQNNLDLLEAQFSISCNDEFHRISEKIRDEVGALDSKRIFFEWNDWLKRTLKKKQFTPKKDEEDL